MAACVSYSSAYNLVGYRARSQPGPRGISLDGGALKHPGAVIGPTTAAIPPAAPCAPFLSWVWFCPVAYRGHRFRNRLEARWALVSIACNVFVWEFLSWGQWPYACDLGKRSRDLPSALDADRVMEM
jgi:hypothetical protein